jgi:hypothetical protein
MTMPDERYRAVKMAEQLLKDLCDPTKTPRVPKLIRQRASGCLRHYPGTWDLDRAAEGAPDVFQKQMEPLYRMIKQRDQAQNPETTNSLGEDGK